MKNIYKALKRLIYPALWVSTAFLLVALSGKQIAQAQMRKDPRAIALAGAYTTVARDFYASGFNPANLAIVRNYMTMQILQFNFGVSNTSLSIDEYNKFNGEDLELNGKKEELLSLIPDSGLTIYFDTALETPILNISVNNMAITTDIYSVGELRIPKAPFEIMLNGNEVGRNYPVEADGEAIAAAEVAFSNGGVFRGYLAGYTVKLIRGLRYYGVDKSVGNFRTDSTFIVGEGEYVVKSSSGGMGFAVDVGLLAVKLQGWHIGAAINNLYGVINWTGDTKHKTYFYEIDDFNLNRVATEGVDALVKGGNKEKEIDSFTTEYPRILRLGVSRPLPLALIAVDFQKGFSDRFYGSKKSRYAVGAEFYGVPMLHLRSGIAVGGVDEKELGLGFGLRLSSFSLDFAYALRGGYTPHSARGFELSLGLSFFNNY